MIFVLSPSKTLDFESKLVTKMHTQPEMLESSEKLIKILRNHSAAQISKLMDISDKLSMLNVSRYQSFHTPFTPKNARQAILAFKGDVYEGIDVESYSKADFEFAQKHMRILSGLYGLLRPLDLMQPYRLEMGIKLRNDSGKDLYSFWGNRITEKLNEAMKESKTPILINLASEEYFKAVRPKKLEGRVVDVVFKQNKNGMLKIIGLFAKKARGQMASHIVQNKIKKIDYIKDFQVDGYGFVPKLSSDSQFVFVKKLS